MERFFVVFLVFLSFSVSGGRERPHNFIRIAFPVAENEIEWEYVFFLCCPAWPSDAYKDLLKLSLLSNKIYLPLHVASGVIFLKCKSHCVSSCLKLLKRPPSTYHRKTVKYVQAFSTKTENSFTEAHACTAHSSETELLGYLIEKRLWKTLTLQLTHRS